MYVATKIIITYFRPLVFTTSISKTILDEIHFDIYFLKYSRDSSFGGKSIVNRGTECQAVMSLVKRSLKMLPQTDGPVVKLRKTSTHFTKKVNFFH